MNMQLILGYNTIINRCIGEWERGFNTELKRTVNKQFNTTVQLGNTLSNVRYAEFRLASRVVICTVYSYDDLLTSREEEVSNESDLQEVVNKVLTKLWSDINS